MNIYFESGGNFITAAEGSAVKIRCNFSMTDCRDDEPLDDFVTRHGGAEQTAEYLSEQYAKATRI